MTFSRPEDRISEPECSAMRLLYNDGDYTQSVLSLMFECKDETVARHVNRECNHEKEAPPSIFHHKYSRQECVDAYNEVHRRCEFARMSQTEYERLRDDDHPAKDTLITRFGSWTDARREARG